MGALIDSSVLIAAERGEIALDAILAGHGDEPAAIAAITASELLHGIHRLKNEAKRARAEVWIEQLFAVLPVQAFDLATARVHARLGAELRAKGASVGAHDLIIAATAISIGFDVATRDARSFPRIPGIKIVRW